MRARSAWSSAEWTFGIVNGRIAVAPAGLSIVTGMRISLVGSDLRLGQSWPSRRMGRARTFVVYLRRLAVDLVVQRACQDVDDLLARMGVPDRGRVRPDVDARLDHLASGDGQVVALQAGAPQSRRELDRRARDAAVLFGSAHLGLPAGGVGNDATI